MTTRAGNGGSGPAPVDLAIAFVITGVSWSGLEVALRGGGALAIVTAIGAGAAIGLLHGLVWLAVLHGPARAPWPRLIQGTMAIATSLWFITALGAWTKLDTRNAGLAIVAVLGGIGLGALVALACWLFGATARASRGRPVVVALIVGAALASWIDRSFFVGLHAPAHAALRAVTLAGLGFALAIASPLRLRPPWDKLAPVLALLAAAIPFATLGGADAGVAMAPLFRAPITDLSIGTLRRLSDLDGDGHSGWLGGGDCAPFDPEVHPGAIEVADNGVDDNCDGGDATITAIDLAATPIPKAPSPRSVLLVTVETLRADHLGLYGYARDTTPVLQHWATDARVYDRAFSAGAWTSIAIPSLLRGVNARRLTWVPYAETNLGRLIPPGAAVDLREGERGVQTFMLPDGGVPTIGWWLQRRGMTAAAVVDDRFSELLDPSVGAGDGFDPFVDADVIRGRDPDDRVVDLALSTLGGLPRDRPFFLWVHLFGPHSPNTAHPEVPSFGDTLVDGYDHEIRFVDAQLGRLLEGATARDPGLAWIVTADHGEVLQADDRMHGFDLGEPVIRVPLVVGGTSLPPGREPGVVSTLDLVPTILALTETPAPPYLDGIDLASAGASRLVRIDTWHRGFDGALLFDHTGVTDGSIELVLDITKNAWALAELGAPSRSPDAIAREHDPRPLQAAIRAYLDAPPLQITR